MKGAALIVWVGMAVVAGFALFNITFKVEQMEGELNRLNKEILKEQNAVHVLQAEWSYLNRPDRIESLVRKLLPDLRSPDASQIGDFNRLDNASISIRAKSDGAASPVRPASVKP